MTGKDRINKICEKVPGFAKLYNARVRHYLIKEHTLNVFNQFERYFAKHLSHLDIEEFRLFLILHDIGKPLAYKEGNKENQYGASISQIEKYQENLQIPDDAFRLYKSLINSNFLGKYMEGRASIEDTMEAILAESKRQKHALDDFFYLLSVYYQCDVSSYTKDAGGIPFLEHLFIYQDGNKVFDENLKLLKFRGAYKERYSNLSLKIKEYFGTNETERQIAKADSLATKDIKVNIRGKIDLSKFQRKQKEIDNSKQNFYVIDTNVFVDYPEVIEKISKEYTIVLSAKVIDELDKLKNTLNADGQMKVQKALRSINHQIDRREIKLELSDLDLLPKDFNPRSPDNFILSVLLKFPNANPILLTSDNGLLIKAKGLGISTLTLKDLLRRRR